MGSRPRNVYQRSVGLQLMCRVCLTISNNTMFDLVDGSVLLKGNNGDKTIYEALQKVTASKIILHRQYPRYICPICLSFLKIAFKFINEFEDSQTKLNEILNDNCFLPNQKDSNDIEKSERKPLTNNSTILNNNCVENPVEVIYGEQKYHLNELLLVEKTEESCDFEGFLKNLGKEITATFANEASVKQEDKSGNTKDEISFSLVDHNELIPTKKMILDKLKDTAECAVESEDNIYEETLTIQIVQDNDDEDINSNLTENESLTRIEECETNHVDVSKKVTQKSQRKKSDKKRYYPCDVCKKIFEKSSRLKVHKFNVHPKNPREYYCEICGYKNNTLSAHKQHRTKHIGKRWTCEICKKSYYTKAVLKVHMRSHTNERDHLCTICGKNFNYSNALLYHMRLHTGEKNYLCRYCGQKFRMPNALNRHVRIHTGERPYQCSYCDKAFRSRGELNCHESLHTGQRPYHCKYCKKGFSKTHNLKMHLLSHKGPHKCDICGRNFIEPAILNMHYKVSHRDLFQNDVSECISDS